MKVDISADVRMALDLYLVLRLIDLGQIVDKGTRFLLKVPKFRFEQKDS